MQLKLTVTKEHLYKALDLCSIKENSICECCILSVAAEDAGIENVTSSLGGVRGFYWGEYRFFSIDENGIRIIELFDSNTIIEEDLPVEVILTKRDMK